MRVRDGVLYFDYPAKHGKRRIQAVVDHELADDVCRLKMRRGGGDELLAYKAARRWTDVKSPDINAWLKEATGEDVSAKDFRTWGATVVAAVGLAVSPVPDTKTARKRASRRVVKEVAYYLGNTPAVARASYIDPRTFERYQDGITIAGALPDLGDAEDPGDRDPGRRRGRGARAAHRRGVAGARAARRAAGGLTQHQGSDPLRCDNGSDPWCCASHAPSARACQRCCVA